MSVQEQQYDIVIVGAGMIGSVCALALADKTNYSIAVVERSESLSKALQVNQRVVALGDIATNLLKELGVFSEFTEESCHAYNTMFVWDENSQGKLSFSAHEHQRSELGYIIDSVNCTRILQRKMSKSEAIDLHYGFDAQELWVEDQSVVLGSHQQNLRGRVLIAADGNRSWVRQRAKIFAPAQDYKQEAIVATIQTSLPHQNTAWQRFLSTGPVAVLPLHKNQSSIVWSSDTQYANGLMGLSDAEFEIELAKALEQKLGSVHLLSSRLAFPLQSRKADTYCKKRLVLIGDAAHSIHPLAGQGANLGFKDVVSLTQLMHDASESSIGDLALLHKYQRSRQLDNRQTDLLMTALHQGFKSDSPWWTGIRGQGMNAISKSTALKKLLVTGAVGDQ